MSFIVRATPLLTGITLLACAPSTEASLAPDPNEGQTFSSVVSASEGGTVASTGDTITVALPPGALAASATVTVAVEPAGGGTLTSVYALGPDGTTFTYPVTISVAYEGHPPADQRVVLAWRDGSTWRPIPGSRLVDGRIVGATRHFSAYAGVGVSAAEAVYPWGDGQGDESAMTYWTWTDATTGLTWQMPSAVHVMNWNEALDYCAGLYDEGGGWRLPSIDELRTLVRGCPATEPGGACGVTETCLDLWQCFTDTPESSTSACNGCMDGGCSWDPALFYEGEPDCVPSYWSSSTYHAVIPGTGEPTPEDGLWAWTMSYAGAMVGFNEKSGALGSGPIRVRCVR